MSITMRDVARTAGVSIKTVSRVVNQQGEIGDATRQRVLTVIAELGYRPSKLARAMVTQRTDTIGFVLADITNPFFPEVARGVEDTAEASGYRVFLCNTDGDVQCEIRALQSLADHAVDGIIIFPSYDVEESLHAFAALGHSVVVINRPFDYPGISRVMIATRRGAQLALEHLIGKGHTNIAMLAGEYSATAELERVIGYREALAAHGLPVRAEWISYGKGVRERGRLVARDLLTRSPEITAIFAYNDLLAIGAIRACRELGRRVPQDCAIIGFDDIHLADMIAPALTTVRIQKYELGQLAMTRLIAMLNDPTAIFEPICSDVELVVRESA